MLLYRADHDSLAQRTMDRSPIEFRTEMYSAGWQMFVEKPILGWGNEHDIQAEVEKRVSSFHPEYYVFHNTFLEIAVERGLLGLGFYAWLMICLFRLAKRDTDSAEIDDAFSNPQFRRLWPLLLGVYLLNASAVVMNYQFVNAVLFTIAGILATQTSGKRQLFGQAGLSK
jgi:O-antigen ligase